MDISWNGFSSDGSEALGEALMRNNTLTYLDMSNNRLHDKGVFKLMKGLQKNQALEILIVCIASYCLTLINEIIYNQTI